MYMKSTITQIITAIKKGICRFAPMNRPVCKNITSIMMVLVFIGIGWSIISYYYKEGLDPTDEAVTSARNAKSSEERAKSSTGTIEEKAYSVKQSEKIADDITNKVNSLSIQTDKYSKEADKKSQDSAQTADKVIIATNKVDSDAAKFKNSLENTLADAKKRVLDVLVEKEPVPYGSQKKD